jgi:hypothetical protein
MERLHEVSEDSKTCEECLQGPHFNWRELPMNEEIRKRLVTQPPVVYHLTFMDAAKAWGPQITEGLTDVV